jgi:hypothetical protein
MAAKDSFHATVKQALIKDGWLRVVPLTLKLGNTRLEVDLSAERLLVAEKANIQIAVEVKSFLSASVVYEFHQAIGQYLHYRLVLERMQSPRLPYLAVPDRVYDQHFGDEFFQASLAAHGVQLIVVEIESEEIRQWIPTVTPNP